MKKAAFAAVTTQMYKEAFPSAVSIVYGLPGVARQRLPCLLPVLQEMLVCLTKGVYLKGKALEFFSYKRDYLFYTSA